MPISVNVSLSGDRAMIRELRKLSLPEGAPIYRRALRSSGKRVRRVIRLRFLAGQALALRSGRLSRSIEIDESALPASITIGSALPQAGPLHTGWPARRMPGRPFIEPALDLSIPFFQEDWVREMEREIRPRSSV